MTTYPDATVHASIDQGSWCSTSSAGDDQSWNEFCFISHQLLQTDGLLKKPHLRPYYIPTRIRKAKLAAPSLSKAAIVQAASLFFWQLRNLRRRSRATGGASCPSTRHAMTIVRVRHLPRPASRRVRGRVAPCTGRLPQSTWIVAVSQRRGVSKRLYLRSRDLRNI